MFYRFLAFLLVIVAFSNALSPKFMLRRVGAPPPNCPDDQYKAAQACFKTYYGNWQITPPFNFENFEKAYDNDMDTNGVQGFDQACGWYDDLNKCLANGNVNIDNCIVNEAWEDWFSLNLTEAETFRTTYFIFGYECDPNQGKPIVDANFVCLRDIKKWDVNDMNSCQQKLNNALNNGQDFCRAYNDYITCVDLVYKHFCGKQVVPWICNVEEIGLKTNYQGCNRVLQDCKTA